MSDVKIWFIMAAVAVSATGLAQQPPQPNPMPPAATEVLARLDKDIAIAKAKAAASLDKILKDTTKKGDLVGAMAVKQALDELKKDTGPQGRGGQASIVGKWIGPSWSMEFLPDGTVRHGNGWRGTWIDNGTTVEVKLESGQTQSLRRTQSGYVGELKDGAKTQDITYRPAE